MLEIISGELRSEALVRWAPRLPRLQSLELFDGKPLEDPLLEMIYVSGLELNDVILPSIGALPNLRDVTLGGISKFSVEGLCDFISQLGPGNQGIRITIESAEAETALNDESQALVSEMLAQQVGGTLDYTLYRALTAQNTQGVQDIHHTPPAFLKKQLDAVCDDVGVDVVKTGMLASAETIEIVADAFRRYGVRMSVVDPVGYVNTVMVSTSGSHLLPESAISTLIAKLLPLTTILTPNLPEAELLLRIAGVDIKSPENVDDVVKMAKRIQHLGPKYVLLKGGHLPLTKGRLVSKGQEEREIVLNVLVSQDEVTTMESEYLHSKNTHGTGCSLASAIACNLASGMSMAKAVSKANRYIEAGIKTSADLGKGSGPINHFHSTYTLPFAQYRGGFIQYLLDRDDIQKPWKEYTEHEFVQKMGDGSLPVENYKYYLIQDYLFLVQFARATALGAYKSSSLVDIGRSVQQVVTLQEEIKLHIDFCKEQGLSVRDIESQEEDQATTAYTRYVLDIGQSQDWLALQVALLPCLIGYGIIAKRLFDDTNTLKEGRYWTWIQQYVDKEYMEAMARGSALIEEHACKQSVSRIDELAQIFIHATNMERGFWDMGMRAGGAAI
ncbi:ATP-dependent RNA helicase dbp2 [Nothophoma quercina]|uniref:ATP-dependent RNA helicase dbp2 n=1 Tax=Nothophoma quercina TaxID=749835 RepID=A0ABR3RRZ0_9PLEO